MANEIVVRKNEDSSDKALEVLKTIVQSSPLVAGLGAMAINSALFRSGAYEWTNSHERSMLGGPVWFTVGSTLTPAEEYWSKIETFIMLVTALQAAGGLGSAGLGGLVNSLKGS